MKKYAVIPDGTDMSEVVDLTIGKRYEIVSDEGVFGVYGLGFFIIDDARDEINCLKNRCAYLGGQNWEIQEGDLSDVELIENKGK